MRRILSALSVFSVPAVPARAKSAHGTAKATATTADVVNRTAGRAVSTAGAAGLDALEALEGRQMMTVNILNPISDRTVGISSASVIIDLNNRYDNPLITGTVLRFNTNQPGTANSFNVELFDAAKASGDTTQPFRTRTTPLTVANFLNYRNAGRYTNSIIHRSVPNFVIQGGGFTGPTSPSNAAGPEADPREISTFPAVTNEPGNSNARGTIAMARVGGQINSATSQWFINTVNNNTTLNGATNLDAVDEGFTAFARVLGDGMTVVDAMAAVPNYNANVFYGLDAQAPLNQLPLRDLANNTTVIQPNQFVTFTSIVVVNEITYTALTNNGALVSPSFNSAGNLVLGFNPGQSGAAVITVRATSSDGSFVDDSFTVGVTPVTIGPVVSNVLSVAYAGLPISLSAASPTSIGAGIARVDFFRDVNNNGLVDTGTDVLLGSDLTDVGGWTLNNVSTLDFPAGNVTILAVAVDDSPSAFRSAPSATTVAVLASTPVSIAAVGTSAPNNIIAYTGVPLTVTATTPTTIADSATITRVETFRDVNNNGVYDSSIDVSLGFDTDGGDGWAITADTTLLGQGTNSLLTIATDSTGRTSVPRMTTLTVTALSPVSVGIFSVNPGVLTRLTDPLTLRLSSAATQVAAATIANVKFYRDFNGNGTFDVADELLGTVTTPTAGGAYELVISDPSSVGFVRNTNNVFAVATDSSDRTSVAVRQLVTGAPPVTASPAAVLRGNSTIFSVAPISGTAAPTRSVAFYVDRNGDGIVSAGDTLLGNGTLAGGIYRITVSAAALALGAANTGSFTVMARATLTNNSSVDYANSTVVVANNLPRVNSVVSSLPVITVADSDFRLTATVSDRDGTVSRVTFYADSDLDGIYTPGADSAVGVDDSATGGWTISLASVGRLTGSYRFFAVATDNNGGQSVPAEAIGGTPAQGTVVIRLNATPTIAAIGGLSTVTRGGMLTLQALQVLDDQQIDNDPAKPATIRRVEFFRDVDNDGLLTLGVDVFLGNGVRNTSTGLVTYRLVIPTAGYQSGENGFLARAVDSDNITGAVVSGTAVISNAAPRVPTATATPASSNQPGVGIIRFTAGNVSDPDGTIANVAFFLDSNNDGQLQPGADTLLGEDVSASGGWTITAATPATSGIFRVFCVVTDREGSSTNGIVFIRINPLPVISIANGNGVVVTNPASGPVARGSNFTVVARGVTDAPGDTGGTVSRVEFWRDLNGNNTIEATDQRLGNGVRSLGTGNRVDYTYTGTSAGFATGANTIMARAVDNNGGLGLPVNTTLAVSNAVPIVGTLAIAGTVLATPGVDSLTLTATFPATTLGAIGRVQFYFDSNNDGVFNIADDLLVGTDTSAAGGWTAVASTSTVTSPTARYFAVITDTDSVVASAVATAVINVNTRPTIGSLGLSVSSVARLASVVATSQAAADADGTVSRVEFWRDRAGGTANAIDAGDQLLGVGVRQTDGTFRLSFRTAGFATGDNTILSQSVDNRGGKSLASTATLAVTNAAPVITGVTATPTLIVTAGVTTISFTATGVADADGGVANVRFYRDTDNDNAFTDGVDTLLGTDTSSQGGWTWANASTAGVTGASTQYFAIATDTDGATAISSMRVVTVNQLPTVGGIVLSSTTAIRRSNITATATGVVDPDTGGAIGRVEFWRDSDRNSVIGTTAQDQFLGNGVRQSDGTYRITFSTANFASGIAIDPFTGTTFDNTLLVRAIDSRGGVGATTSTTLTVSDVAPVAGRFVPVGTAGVVANPASPLTLTITGPTDADGTILEAFFYFDANNNGVVDTGTDILLGSDNNAAGGWSLLFSPTAVAGEPFVSGVIHRVLAVVRDNNNVRSEAVSTTFTFNQAPVVGSVTVNGTGATGLGSISRTSTANTLVASGVTDNGSIARVEFWLDSNNDGAITSADRLLGIGTRIGTTTTWQFAFNGSIIPGTLTGEGKLLTRSIDNLGRASLLAINTITIT